jgi:DNA transformation protein
MASDQEFVKFVCEQLCGAGEISSRRMFGEAAVYLQDKVIGLICDNQFFVKATESGRAKVLPGTQRPR